MDVTDLERLGAAIDALVALDPALDNARIFGGMHWHHSVIEGNWLGSQVTEYILNHKLCRADDQCGGDEQ